MAAPHVAGAAALYLWRHPGASPKDVLKAQRDAGEREPEAKKGTRNHFDPADKHDEPVLHASGL